MKKLFAILAIVLCAGQVWAEPIVWDYSINDYTTLDCPNLLNEERKALRELYPRPDPCPWRTMSVPEDKVEQWEDEGWEPFGVMTDWAKVGSRNYIWIKKRICQEGK